MVEKLWRFQSDAVRGLRISGTRSLLSLNPSVRRDIKEGRSLTSLRMRVGGGWGELYRLGFGGGLEEAEELFDAGDLKGTMDAVIDTDEGERAAVFIMGHVGADEGADAG